MPPIETSRRYYHDSYVTRFAAEVVETTELGGRPAAILDQTFFYPTSGGQPHDRGALDGRQVIGVEIRASDGAVLHLLDGPIPTGPVAATIDWTRRLDHMQQHTGQHILSQAFVRVAAAPTIGFHLGEEYVSIDLDTAGLEPAQVDAAFQLANEVVSRNLPVRAWFPTEAELATITLRKTPEVEGALRIVAIGDFDVSACGGTHVAGTGEVGLLHWLRTERLKRGARISFLAGDRARRDYAAKQRIVAELSARLTCAVPELPGAVARLAEELETTRRALARHEEAALDREAAELRAGVAGAPVVVRRVWAGRPAEQVRGLALRITAEPGAIALLATAGDRTQFVLARSEDLTVDLKPALDAALAAIGGGKGGGGRVVQGGGAGRTEEEVARALAAAAAALAPGAGR